MTMNKHSDAYIIQKGSINIYIDKRLLMVSHY